MAPAAADAEGEASVEASLIGEHVAAYHGDDVAVSSATGKGRVLLAAREVEAGELILLEYPLVEVVADKAAAAYLVLLRLREQGRLAAAPPLFYWSALCSLTSSEVEGASCRPWPTVSLGTQLQVLELHAPTDACEAASESTQAVAAELWPGGGGPDLVRFERILQCWVYNSFDQSDGDGSAEAGGLYLAASMLSHSCSPNAAWHLDEANNYNLHARCDIEEGEEITIPYLSVEDLCLPKADRRESLQSSKDFWCGCERCAASVDDARSFRCPRSGGVAFVLDNAAATGVDGGSAVAGAEAGDALAATLTSSTCGTLSAEEALPLLAAEEPLSRWARSWLRLGPLRSEVDTEAEAEGAEAAGAAVPERLLAAAEAAGLLGRHWAVDAARAAVAEARPEEACRMLRLRAEAWQPVPFALAKYARLCLALGRTLACKGAAEEALREAIEWFSKASRALSTLFGDDDPEHHEAERLREDAMRQLVSRAVARGRAASAPSTDAEDGGGGAGGQAAAKATAPERSHGGRRKPKR